MTSTRQKTNPEFEAVHSSCSWSWFFFARDHSSSCRILLVLYENQNNTALVLYWCYSCVVGQNFSCLVRGQIFSHVACHVSEPKIAELFNGHCKMYAQITKTFHWLICTAT